MSPGPTTADASFIGFLSNERLWPAGGIQDAEAAVHFEGEYRIKVPPDRVYPVLVNPQRIVRYLPDVEVLELETVDADSVEGEVRTGVSFLRGTFRVTATIVERDPPRRARMRVRSQGMGSTFDIETSMDLRADGPETLVAWSADTTIRGTVASMGARLLPGLVEKKTEEFLEALRADLEGRGPTSTKREATRKSS